MEKRQLETMVGLFVLLGVLAMVFLSLKAANLASFTLDSTYALTARFDNVGGLKIRAPVKSAGVTVGRIRTIGFDDKSFRGVVTMDIDRNYNFPADTSAKILTSGLLGDQYVGLEPGGDDKNLAGGDEIKMTQSAIVIENLIGQMLYNKAAEGGGKDSPKDSTKDSGKDSKGSGK